MTEVKRNLYRFIGVCLTSWRTGSNILHGNVQVFLDLVWLTQPVLHSENTDRLSVPLPLHHGIIWIKISCYTYKEVVWLCVTVVASLSTSFSILLTNSVKTTTTKHVVSIETRPVSPPTASHLCKSESENKAAFANSSRCPTFIQSSLYMKSYENDISGRWHVIQSLSRTFYQNGSVSMWNSAPDNMMAVKKSKKKKKKKKIIAWLVFCFQKCWCTAAYVLHTPCYCEIPLCPPNEEMVICASDTRAAMSQAPKVWRTWDVERRLKYTCVVLFLVLYVTVVNSSWLIGLLFSEENIGNWTAM